jgi:hypothetical protein
MWINEALKSSMDFIERDTCSLRKANISWNIPLNLFFYHTNEKTRSRKMGPRSMFIK